MTKEQLKENLEAVRAKIAEAAAAAGRDPGEITLVAASKVQTGETIKAAVAAGLGICGENRVQELTAHLEENAYAGAELHFIGHLQTNKVNKVVGAVALIHSVDSERLLDAIDRQAAKIGIVQDILLEVNIGREENKGGALPEQILPLAEMAAQKAHIRLRGLMCVPPATGSDDELRAFFAQTRKLYVDTREKIGDNVRCMDCLSMGMSGDFPLAIAEGATLVRVGTAIFGARNYN